MGCCGSLSRLVGWIDVDSFFAAVTTSCGTRMGSCGSLSRLVGMIGVDSF